MADILITEDISGPAMDALCQKYDVAFEPELWKTPQRLRDRVRDIRGLIVRNQTRVDPSVISRAGRLEVIGRAGAGVENIDIRAASQSGVVVTYAPSQNSISVAELTLGLMLSLARMIPVANTSTHAGGWERQRFTGIELYAKTLGIVGLGRIGYLAAARAKAFGMNVIAYDPAIDPDSPSVTELRARLVPFPQLLAESDFISCHVPDTPQTRDLFDKQAFAQVKQGAFLINTARGPAVDEEALIRALRESRLAGAALDVRREEPPQASPFYGMENVILTPHIAAFTREGQDRVVATVCRDVDVVLRGEAPRHFFNFPRPNQSREQTAAEAATVANVA